MPKDSSKFSCATCLRNCCLSFAAVSAAAIYAAWQLYPIIDEGELYLENAPSEVRILREADTAILHIRADDWPSMAYGSGFASAQNRLWQLQRTRMVASGRICEMFGPMAMPIDEFMRLTGVREHSERTWELETLDPEFRAVLESYADGVNDYVADVSLWGDEQRTDRLLPPEFLAFGFTKSNWEPWTPVDSLMVMRLMSLHLTWNWHGDLFREIFHMLSEDVGALAEEIFPFTADMMTEMAPIVNDDDLKEWGQYSETTLSEKYRQNPELVASAAARKINRAKVSPKIRAYKDNLDGYLGSDVPLLGQPMASNAFVISGEHTETGMPILESDPHLANQLPSQHMLTHFEFNDGRVLSGSMIPGWPTVIQGKTNHLTWGFTASRVDSSDMWEETLNEDGTEYLVDGEWRKLEISEQTVKVFLGSDVTLPVRKTHRGVLIPFETLKKNSALLFGGKVPDVPDNGKFYSFAWQGQYAGEDAWGLVTTILESKSVPELFEVFDKEPLGEAYKGIGQNTLMADTSGNIGYRLITTMPVRKEKTPFIGSRILDGTTSQFDWTGEVVPQRDLPRSLNPKRGYITSANGRQTSDHAINDYGASVNSHARQLRIDQMFQEKIASGVKFTIKDMNEIMHDLTDIFALKNVPKMLQLVRLELGSLPEKEQAELKQVMAMLESWDGSFDKESIVASLYTRWQWAFNRNLWSHQTDNVDQRQALSFPYHFVDFYQRVLAEVIQEGPASHYQEICAGAYTAEEYSGENYCAFNMAKALLFSKQWHEENISRDPAQWTWGGQNHKEYQNLPWSKIPGLSKFFHRSVPASGSTETPNMSKIRDKDWDQKYIQSMASANFKFITQMAKDPKDDVSLYSMDTGMHGNPFQGHYFDMNEKHLKGELLEMKWTREKLEGTPVKTLVLKPKKAQGGKKDQDTQQANVEL